MCCCWCCVVVGFVVVAAVIVVGACDGSVCVGVGVVGVVTGVVVVVGVVAVVVVLAGTVLFCRATCGQPKCLHGLWTTVRQPLGDNRNVVSCRWRVYARDSVFEKSKHFDCNDVSSNAKDHT
jgi:hypothetical protein